MQENDLPIQPRDCSSKSPRIKKTQISEERSTYELERAKRVQENRKFLFDCGLVS